MKEVKIRSVIRTYLESKQELKAKGSFRGGTILTYPQLILFFSGINLGLKISGSINEDSYKVFDELLFSDLKECII